MSFFQNIIKNPEELVEIVFKSSGLEMLGPVNANSHNLDIYATLARSLYKSLIRLSIDDIEIRIFSIPKTKLCCIIFYSDLIRNASKYESYAIAQDFLWRIIEHELSDSDNLYIYKIDCHYLCDNKIDCFFKK